VEFHGKKAILSIQRDVTKRRRSAQEVERLAAELGIMRAVDQAVLAGEPLENVARAALARLLDLVPVQRASVILYDDDRRTARPLVQAGALGEVLPKEPLPLVDWGDRDDLRRGKIRYLADLQVDSKTPLHERLRESGLRSFITIPLLAASALLGELNLASAEPHAFDEDRRHLAHAVGNELAIALHRARLGQKLIEERARLAALMNGLPDGVALLDANGRVLLENARGREHMELLARSEQFAAGKEALASATKPTRLEVTVQGRVLDVRFERIEDERGVLTGSVLLSEDVTTERAIEHRVQEHERLAAVGQLAAGVAHDFNNLLQGISAHTELAAHVSGMTEVRRRLDPVLELSERGARLIRQILDFSRKTPRHVEPRDLGALVERGVEMLHHSIPDNVVLSVERGSEPVIVQVDEAQIEQVLTNLVLNARDAMPEGGLLEVRVGSCEPPADAPELPEQCAFLSVRDTGLGIDDDVLPRVFEPFFTTKEPGHGTGLGLSQVYGIARQHDGIVRVKSRTGEGTAFTVYLPLHVSKP
jgi:signal transduction histidine kinase